MHRLSGRVDYFIRAMASTVLQEHVLPLFKPYTGEGLDALIADMVEEGIDSLVDAAAGHHNPSAIIDAVEAKMREVGEGVEHIDRWLRDSWKDDFLAIKGAKIKLLGPPKRCKPVNVKMLFMDFLRGTANNHSLGGHRMRVLIDAIEYYKLKCEEDLGTLQQEYAQRQLGLHGQLKWAHAISYFMRHDHSLGRQDALARLGRQLAQGRGGATPCFYKTGLVLGSANELQQLLNQHQQPPTHVWGSTEEETLTGPGVFGQLSITFDGKPLNGHARRSDLLLSLAAQIKVTRELPAEKESLADKQQGVLLLHELMRVRAGQQQQQALPELINIEARNNALQILQSFASLHEVYVDIFHFNEECTPPQVTAVYRIIPEPLVLPQQDAPRRHGIRLPQQAARRPKSYKVCWSARKGFGPALMVPCVHIDAG